jgi:N-methylhydantoinase B
VADPDKDNIRASDMVVGDMEAQIAACRIGAERMADLAGRYGVAMLRAASLSLMQYSERLMRQAIADLPDGTYSAETFIDGFQTIPTRAGATCRSASPITVKGDDLTVDLTGTAPQVDDRPINMPLVGTVDVAIWLTVRSILLDSDVYGYIPRTPA